MCSFDRGAFAQLTFNRCVRGFTLVAHSLDRDARYTLAFDRIEDLAAWLVEQYGPPQATALRNEAEAA